MILTYLQYYKYQWYFWFSFVYLFNGISTPHRLFYVNILFPSLCLIIIITIFYGDARGVVVIVVGNGHGDTSSNPGRDWLHFT